MHNFFMKPYSKYVRISILSYLVKDSPTFHARNDLHNS